MKADRKRLKVEKADLVSQMQQLYATLESREEQLREFIRNYDQHRKVTPTHLILSDLSSFVCTYSIQEMLMQRSPEHDYSNLESVSITKCYQSGTSSI